MSSIERLIPDYVVERSLVFKSYVIVVGALLLLVSTFLRDTFPILWIVPFLGGALIEWLVVATVYIEISQIEAMIEERKAEINRTQSEIEETQSEIEETKDNTFSRISDSQGVRASNSIEDRVSELEDKVGVDRSYKRGLADKVDNLEQEIEELKRDLNRRR